MFLKELSTDELHTLYSQVRGLMSDPGTMLSKYLENRNVLSNIVCELDTRAVIKEAKLAKLVAKKNLDELHDCYTRLCQDSRSDDPTTLRYQYRMACCREIYRRANVSGVDEKF